MTKKIVGKFRMVFYEFIFSICFTIFYYYKLYVKTIRTNRKLFEFSWYIIKYVYSITKRIKYTKFLIE